jgi:hypothetical protein
MRHPALEAFISIKAPMQRASAHDHRSFVLRFAMPDRHNESRL